VSQYLAGLFANTPMSNSNVFGTPLTVW
jgi:hypothetical protein